MLFASLQIINWTDKLILHHQDVLVILEGPWCCVYFQRGPRISVQVVLLIAFLATYPEVYNKLVDILVNA